MRTGTRRGIRVRINDFPELCGPGILIMILLFFHKKGNLVVKRRAQRKREVKREEAASMDEHDPRRSFSLYFYV